MSAREEAMGLLAAGVTPTVVARELGLCRSTVSAWADPDTAAKQKARRLRYRRPCPECGELMDGSGGYKTAPSLCAACSRQLQHDQRRWTPETVVTAIRRWAELHGRRPWSSEWLVSPGPDWPCAGTVLYVFGSWANAVEAAGFDRPTIGGYPRTGMMGMTVQGRRVLALLEAEGPLTSPQVGRATGITHPWRTLNGLRRRGLVEATRPGWGSRGKLPNTWRLA